MKSRRVTLSILFVNAILFSPYLRAQTGDWSLVQQLQPGTRISVKAQRRLTCVLESADDRALICRIETPRYFNYSPDVFFDRRDVREVRLEHSDGFHAGIGTAIGFVVGAAVGAAKTSAAPGLGALIFGSVGAMTGHQFGPDIAIIHGPVVYRR